MPYRQSVTTPSPDKLARERAETKARAATSTAGLESVQAVAAQTTSRSREHLRKASPLAKALYRLLQDRSDADRRHVLFAARAQLVEARPERTQLSLNAMRVCLADNDGRLSRGRYDQWRKAQADPTEWPSSEFIRNTFHTWRRAMDAAGADVVGDVLATRLVSHGRRFTREEILAGVQAFAETGRPLTWPQYRAWAIEEMQRPDRELFRVIRSMKRVAEIFGSWAGCLAAAGLGQRYLDESQQRLGPLGPRHDADPERVVDWVRRAGQATDGGQMTVKVYDAWVKEQRREELERTEQLRSPPSSQTVSRVLGSWAEALYAAGFIDRDEAILRHGRRRQRLTDGQLVAWLARAIEAVGPEVTQGQYESWRAQWLRANAFAWPGPPGERYLRRRLGGWPAARTRATAWQTQALARRPPPGARAASDHDADRAANRSGPDSARGDGVIAPRQEPGGAA